MQARHVGLGTYRLGTDTERVCLSALELGYRHIDTASLYGNEAAVGTAVRLCGLDRSELVVTSKVWTDDIEADTIADAVGRSIDHIGQIDVMLLHAPVGDAAMLDRSWTSLLHACNQHGIAAAGVSNYRREHIDALSSVPAVNQIEVSPFLPRTDLVAHCHQLGIQTTAHSPLVKAQRLDNQVLVDIADAASLTTAQVLLAWSLANGHTPLPRSSSVEHLAANLAAQDVVVADADLRRIDALADDYATHPVHIG